jgi:hypothetical protein
MNKRRKVGMGVSGGCSKRRSGADRPTERRTMMKYEFIY